MSAIVVTGDCLAVLRRMPPETIDSVVTDPPYGLGFMGKEWDTPGALVERKADRNHRWDHVGGNHNPTCSADAARTRRAEALRFQRWCEAWTLEVFRVLKPCGHVLAFGATRTYHRMTCAVEDAGFEIRDSIHWLYGSGFPKSLNISKKIDETAPRAGLFDAFALHYEAQRKSKGLAHAAVCEAGKFYDNINHGGASVNWSKGHNVPTLAQWAVLQPLLDLSLDFLPLIERVETEREVVAARKGSTRPGFSGDRFGEVVVDEYNITAPATEAAKKWHGWGTALKPSHEPIVVARKPLMGTVAENVLAHDTGGLNVDGCRIEADELLAGGGGKVWTHYRDGTTERAQPRTSDGRGRWPANVVLTCCGELPHLVGCVVAELDGQSGLLKSGANPTRRDSAKFKNAYSEFRAKEACVRYREADVGGASRFYYVAKPSRRERTMGGRVNNVHPTVKPIQLLRYLVRLVTPLGGTVLDPFAGSGTTGIAALLEGFDFVGIEREPDYVRISRARIAAAPEWAATQLIANGARGARVEA